VKSDKETTHEILKKINTNVEHLISLMEHTIYCKNVMVSEHVSRCKLSKKEKE